VDDTKNRIIPQYINKVNRSLLKAGKFGVQDMRGMQSEKRFAVFFRALSIGIFFFATGAIRTERTGAFFGAFFIRFLLFISNAILSSDGSYEGMIEKKTAKGKK